MYELKTNTAVRIAVGPLVDPGDGKTAETGLTVTGMSVEIFQIKTDGSAVVRTAFSPTASGGNNDMVHVTDDTTGMYDLELTAAQLNWLGNGRIAFYDVDGFLVHWIDIQVVSAAYFDMKYGTTILDVNVTKISGDSDAADNCELMFDGTGYAGGTVKLGVDVVAVSGDTTAADNLELQYDTTGLVGATFPARQDQAGGYHGAIWIDTTNGTAGTTAYVHGTAEKPVKTLADALTLAAALGLHRYHLLPGSAITFTANSQKEEWIGYGATITGGNQNQAGSYFEGATLTGDWQGAISARNCILSAFSGGSGYFDSCILKGNITPAAGRSNFTHCCGDGSTGGIDAVINFYGGDLNLSFNGWYGKITLADMATNDAVMFDSSAGELILLAGCTGGELSRRGFHSLTDNSDGTTVYNLTATADIVDAVWDEAIAGHAVAGSTGEALSSAGTSTDITAIKAKTDLIPASPAAVGSAMTLADDAITAAKFDETTAFPIKSADAGATAVARTETDVVEGTLTVGDAVRLALSVLAGKCSGGGTATIVFRDTEDTKNRVVATVSAAGRSTVVLDAS